MATKSDILRNFEINNNSASIPSSELLNLFTFLDFKSASNEVLTFLQNKIGFDLWMITRTEGHDWILLQAADTGYGIKSPTVLNWTDSFCVQMVQGKGPQVAPISDSVPAYASAPIGEQLKIGAYIGVPLIKSNGALFGTLCAIHPEPQPEAIKEELPLIKLLSQLLSSLLNAEQELNKQVRLTERAEAEALNDPDTGCYNPLTGLYNTNGWWQLLDAEELRCEIYGSPAWVVCIETDKNSIVKNNSVPAHNENNALHVSQALHEATHCEDIIAQIGSDKFAILAVECTVENAKALLERLDLAFKNFGIQFSIGYSARHPEEGLRKAWQNAEDALGRDKNTTATNKL